MRIHVVEANACIRDRILASLREPCDVVAAASDFESAKRLATSISAPLALLNLDDAALRGRELLSAMRGIRGDDEQLVVALSASINAGDLSLADVDDVVFTDVPDEALQIRLAFTIRRTREQQRLRETTRALNARKDELDQTERSLASELNLLKTIIDGSPDVFWVKDRDLRFVRVNQAVLAFLGAASPAEVVGKSGHDMYPPEIAGGYRARELAVMASGEPLLCAVEDHVRDGLPLRTIFSTKIPLKGPDGEIIGLVGMQRDLSNHIQAERAVAASEARFRKMIQHSTDVLLIVDAAARIQWMSPSVERALGRPREQRLGRHIFQHLLLEDVKNARAAFQTTLEDPATPVSAVVRVRAAADSIRTFLFTATNMIDTEVGGIVLNGRDITEILAAQEELRRSQEHTRIALHAAKMASWRFDVRTRKIHWTRETAAKFGIAETAETISIPRLMRLLHPDDREILSRDRFERYVRERNVEEEFRTMWPDGSVHWLQVKGQPSFAESGELELLRGVVFDMSAKKEMERALQTERDLFNMLMNQSPDAIFIKDRHSRFVRVNRTVANRFGCSHPHELEGKTDFDLFPFETAQGFYTSEQRMMETGEAVHNCLDLHGATVDGDKWILTSLVPLRDQNGVVTGLLGSSRDVTEHNRSEMRLAIAETRYRLVVEQIPAITYLFTVADNVQHYDYISPQVKSMLGFTPQEYAETWAKNRDGAFHPDDRERVLAEVERANSAHLPVTIEYRRRMKGGGWKWVRETVSPLPAEGNECRRWQGIMFDLTEDRAFTEQLEHQVFHDSLTGLPNRVLLSRRLEEAIARARQSQRGFALLFIDLDDFKSVNDSMGHHTGDIVLMAVAERLRDIVRAADTVARLSGDEFVMLLSDAGSARDVYDIASCVQHAFRKPFRVGGQDVHLSPSIGVSIYDESSSTPAGMLRQADAAMYEAKRLGKSQTRLYDPAFGAGGAGNAA